MTTAIDFIDEEFSLSSQEDMSPLTQKERDAFKKEIASQIEIAVNAAVESFKPHGWRRVTKFLREWGLAGHVIAVPIALLALVITTGGIALTQFHSATARIEKEATFETNTTNTLKQIDDHLKRIDTSMSTFQLENAAENPTDKRSAIEAKTAIDSARQNSVQLGPELVENAGKRFVEASNQNPAAWNAALGLVSYRSYLNASSPLVPEAPATKPVTHYFYLARSGVAWPVFTVAGMAPKGEAARYELIGDDRNKDLLEGDALLFADGGTVVLDGLQLAHVVFRRVHIIYEGGPLQMKNVYFVNCTFEMRSGRNPQNLAIAVLATDPSTTFSGE